MRRFGILLASAALGGVLVASGPVFARMGGGGVGGGHMSGGFGGGHFDGFRGHFSGFGPRFTGRSVAVGGFDHRFHRFDRDGRFRRFGRFVRDRRFFIRRGLFANGFPFGVWGGGWGYNYPGSDYSYSTGPTAVPLVIDASVANRRPGDYCIISVKTCQLHNPSFVGNDCSCKVTGGATNDIP